MIRTSQNFYLIGTDKTKVGWRILRIDRSELSTVKVYEDPTVYTKSEYKKRLQTLADENHSLNGLEFVTKAYGIVGELFSLSRI